MVLRDAESEQVGKLIGQMHTISTFDVNDQDQDQEVYEMMRPNQANSMVYKQQCQCKNKEFTSGKIQQKKKKKHVLGSITIVYMHRYPHFVYPYV